ncbi:glycosyl transferase group 1 [Natronolimnohabitans innermongolicus JCM 12255]|uniref:Glycosyl transferase group 1 n=1 Tax=Natronolimnohabitans innermongolicus JCM 12255 TaxID=1227499 RepID=L9XII3_9EURY|nr:glycosyl transferase group 1 [Natronolimnohabitans innermongolicus JCM 12255]
MSRATVLGPRHTDGIDCLKCETTAEFPTGIERLATDPSRRRRLGERPRATATERGLERAERALVTGCRRTFLNEVTVFTHAFVSASTSGKVFGTPR